MDFDMGQTYRDCLVYFARALAARSDHRTIDVRTNSAERLGLGIGSEGIRIIRLNNLVEVCMNSTGYHRTCEGSNSIQVNNSVTHLRILSAMNRYAPNRNKFGRYRLLCLP